MAVLKGYYLQLRAASAADPGSLPVTARQLESLVRVLFGLPLLASLLRVLHSNALARVC